MKTILTSVLILLCATPAMATNAMKLIGVGPIQKSMGGASIALPLDSATNLTNPAGISQLDKRVDFGVALFMPDVSYSAFSSASLVTTPARTLDSDSTSFFIPAFGFVLPWTDRVTFGLGAYGVTGMGVDYESNLYNNITYTEYVVMKFNPAVSYALTDNLAIGFAPVVGYAKFEYEAGTTAEVPHQGGSGFGLGAMIGLFYELSEEIDLGIYYETPQWFQDFEYNTVRGIDKIELDQPQTAGVGIAYHPDTRWRMDFDIVWIDWSKQIGSNQPAYVENASGATPFNMNWDDQLVFKLGGEFDLNDKTKLRAGYNYGNNPVDSNQPFEAIAFPAIAKHHISGGVGYRLKDDIDVNFGVTYSPTSSMDAGSAAQFIDSAQIEMSQLSFDFGFSFLFD